MTTAEPFVGATPPGSRGPAPERGRARRWVIIVTVAWVLVLAGAALVAVKNPTITDREETTVAAARPYVDQAIARAASATVADGQAVVAVGPWEKVSECDVTVFRGGQRYGRGATAIVSPGTESALLQRVASRLPASYGASVRTGAVPRLTADAGYFVTLTGSVSSPGEVRFYADTGDCRVPGDVATADPPASGAIDRAAVQTVLGRLGLSAGQWQESAVPCPDGGLVHTVEAHVGAFPGALDVRLGQVPDAVPVVSGPRLYAYRTGRTEVAARAREDSVVVTATTVCG